MMRFQASTLPLWNSSFVTGTLYIGVMRAPGLGPSAISLAGAGSGEALALPPGAASTLGGRPGLRAEPFAAALLRGPLAFSALAGFQAQSPLRKAASLGLFPMKSSLSAF